MNNHKDEDVFFDISNLIKKYILNDLSPEEEKCLANWLKEDEANVYYFKKLTNAESVKHNIKILEDADPVKAWKLFQQKIKPTKRVKIYVNKWMKYAAVILLPLAIAATFLFSSHHRPVGEDAIISYKGSNQSYHNDVSPGGKKAVLTLANGKKIVLNKNAKMQLTESDSTHLQNNSNKLVYTKKDISRHEKILYNKLATPVGGTYQLVLADGTKVWLNAKTSLRFPTSFAGNKRVVYLSGEAYFEVTKNPHQPFEVHTDEGVNIQVLGTHFNVMAYPGEKRAVTSLLEGHVRLFVKDKNSQYDLVPGEAGIYDRIASDMEISAADVNAAVAWKSGLFMFRNNRLSYVMRQIKRWYGVNVEYEKGQAANMHFTGAIRMRENLSKILQMLELTGGAKFSIEGKKVIVLK